MAKTDVKHKTLQSENIIADQGVSSEFFDQVEVAFDGDVNSLSLVALSWKKEGNLCKLSGFVL